MIAGGPDLARVVDDVQEAVVIAAAEVDPENGDAVDPGQDPINVQEPGDQDLDPMQDGEDDQEAAVIGEVRAQSEVIAGRDGHHRKRESRNHAQDLAHMIKKALVIRKTANAIVNETGSDVRDQDHVAVLKKAAKRKIRTTSQLERKETNLPLQGPMGRKKSLRRKRRPKWSWNQTEPANLLLLMVTLEPPNDHAHSNEW